VVRDILAPEYDVVRTSRVGWARPFLWPPPEPGRLTLGRSGSG